jgi:hypothetical protein
VQKSQFWGPSLLRCNCFALGLDPVVLTVIVRTTIDADWLVVVRRPMRQGIQRVSRMLAWCPEDGELMKSAQKASHQWHEPQGRPRWHLPGG